MTRAEQKRQAHSVIYALTEHGQTPNPESIRYIGRTVQLPAERLRKHMVLTRLHNSFHCHAWIRKLAREGKSIQMHVLMIVSHEDSGDYEKRAIRHFKQVGSRLTNHTDGGDGQLSRQVSDATRRKMADSHRGKKLGAVHAAKLRAHLSRIKCLPHVRESRSKSIREVTSRPEVRRKISESNKGKVVSLETRAKISESLKGKVQSEETIAKRGEAIRRHYAQRRVVNGH